MQVPTDEEQNMKKTALSKLIILIFTLYGCATSGAGQEPVGERFWEVRVWNGKLCSNKISVNDCKKVLRPKLDERAQGICDGEPEKVSNCFLSAGMTGRRLKCLVRCK